MKQKRLPDLGPLELKILRIVWADAPLTAPQVLERYNNQTKPQLAYTTVMTLLGRLADKGVLKVDRTRQPYQFSALIPKERILRQRIHDFVNLFFDGNSLDLATRLVAESPLSDDEVSKLENVLMERKAKKKTK